MQVDDGQYLGLLVPALRTGDWLQLRRTIDEIGINICDQKGYHLLHQYAEESHHLPYNRYDMVDFCQMAGLEWQKPIERTEGLLSVLHLAVSANYLDIDFVGALLHYKHPIDVEDLFGNTPLLYFLKDFDGTTKHIRLVKLLIETGADLDKENKYNESARLLIRERYPQLEAFI
jgi:hypothetical protein